MISTQEIFALGLFLGWWFARMMDAMYGPSWASRGYWSKLQKPEEMQRAKWYGK